MFGNVVQLALLKVLIFLIKINIFNVFGLF
jgi:hypothetical protein